MIKIKDVPVRTIYIGEEQVDKIYLGEELIYRSVPYDAEVEELFLIQDDQWFELPIKPSEATDAIEFDFRARKNVRMDYCSTTTGNVFFVYSTNNNVPAIGYYRNGRYIHPSDSTNRDAIGSQRHKLKIDHKNKKVVYDFLTFTTSVKSSLVSDSNLLLFADHNPNDTFKGFYGIIYGVKYWRNDELIYDLIPVRKGGIGYLYDKISGQMFANKGTDPIQPRYDKYVGYSQYTPVDYVQNTNADYQAPYINTLVPSVSNDSITMEMTVKWNTISSSLRQLMGITTSPWFGCDNGVYEGQNIPIQDVGTPSTTTYQTISWTDKSTDNTYIGPLCIFRLYDSANRANNAKTYVCRCKIAGFKIWVDGVLVRDFKPVLHPDGIYGLYDIVGDKFYYSSTYNNCTGGYNT